MTPRRATKPPSGVLIRPASERLLSLELDASADQLEGVEGREQAQALLRVLAISARDEEAGKEQAWAEVFDEMRAYLKAKPQPRRKD